MMKMFGIFFQKCYLVFMFLIKLEHFELFFFLIIYICVCVLLQVYKVSSPTDLVQGVTCLGLKTAGPSSRFLCILEMNRMKTV